ncbi:ribonuclease H-like YkuK family protein [Bacillus sp. PS06]|uniref:ribonuclease H-like YkuK family protein n=1 Tax=Bacillus sp. PS06 TaxID=2764176 RepID=UPI001783ADFF|nr:ribonuclease H-like YkuK family protein [Bacillus sp. PS06]MBD8068481.1 ribonuclease H-like YkuK family protein [Bacillus sp. PS06]
MSESLPFYNISESNLQIDDVIDRIKRFIEKDPCSRYVLSIGTDSQVHQEETRFITAVHLHRVGKGAWGCLRNYTMKRPIRSVREKISIETSLSQVVAYLFTTTYLMEIMDLLIPFADDGADLTLEVHLDIGKKGVTKDLINEMTGRITSMGLEAKIKPDSYAAFSYANRFTK